MKEQADLLTKILLELKDFSKIGVSLLEIDTKARELLKKYKAESCNLGYHNGNLQPPFPAVICASVNDCIAHGIPDPLVLKDGDLLGLDMGIKYKGLCADAAFTFPIGELSGRDERLLRYTRRSIYEVLPLMKPGVKIYEIGTVIERFAKRMGFVVNKRFMGHKIGKEMHQAPYIPHFEVVEEHKEKLKAEFELGGVYCVEPQFTYKDEWGQVAGDHWSCFTRDNQKSAMFEHMIEVTEQGGIILTKHFNNE